jgi:polyphenol oxidase
MQTRTLLSSINWEIASKTSSLLTRMGIEHGFYGLGDTAPESNHVRQVHGTKVSVAAPETTGAKATNRIEADGIFTTEAGLTIAVKTADCIPILLAAPGQMVMGIHAGWRGLTAGIIDRGVNKMLDSGIAAERIFAAVGPSISRERFEIGPEVVDALMTPASGLSAEQVAFVLSKGLGDRWHLDLAVAAALSLANAGIPATQISVVQACTFSSNTQNTTGTKNTMGWSSYRREGKGAGVNWSWIRLS